MAEETGNPFDVTSYSSNSLETTPITTESMATELPQETNTTPSVETSATTEAIPSTETVPSVTTVVATPAVQVTAEQDKIATEPPATESKLTEFKWENDVAKDIYNSLVSGNISEVADLMYEQKVLSEVDKMSESDIIKLKIAYDYPDLTSLEIEEEYDSKYSVDKDFDQSLLSEEEITAKNKQLDKQEKSLARELKKDVREAKEYLQTLKQDISFPDILSQFQQQPQQTVNSEEIVNQYLTAQQESNSKDFQQAREVFEKSIDQGLKDFEGFKVNYKDEDVQFDGSFTLSQEDKMQLQETMKSFDLESFYGGRYYKDGQYDTKQLAEDIYLLQNKDKVVNAMVTQAVSKAKSDFLKGIKNIDYANAPRTTTAQDLSEMDKMVSKMFSI